MHYSFSMTEEQHIDGLGRLVANLQSIEFMVRIVLSRLPGAVAYGIPKGTNTYSYAVGSDLPENDVTNYDSLGQLIDRYNAHNDVKKEGAIISRDLVELRDILAHGRVSTVFRVPMDLIKFSRPNGGRVTVVCNVTMDEPWFEKNLALTRNSIAILKRMHDSLPPT